MIRIKIVRKKTSVHKLLALMALTVCILIGIGNHYDLYNENTASLCIVVTVFLFLISASMITTYQKSGEICIMDDCIGITEEQYSSMIKYSFSSIQRFRMIFTGIKGTLVYLPYFHSLKTYNGISKIEIIDDKSNTHEYLVSISSEHTYNLFRMVFKDLDEKHPGKIEFLYEDVFNVRP
jgi:hypothetical protein